MAKCCSYCPQDLGGYVAITYNLGNFIAGLLSYWIDHLVFQHFMHVYAYMQQPSLSLEP